MRHLVAANLLCIALSMAIPGFAQQNRPDLLTGQPRSTAETTVDTPEKQRRHPIDREISALLDNDPSTAGQIRAFEKGIELWDAELNRAYKELFGKLGDDGRKALKEAQRAWLAFRDAEFKRFNLLYSGKDGSMFIPMGVAARLELIKARALELVQSIEIIEM